MTAAGWYNDEWDPALARWFDGHGWTEHTLVKAEWRGPGAPPPPTPPSDERRFAGPSEPPFPLQPKSTRFARTTPRPHPLRRLLRLLERR